MAFAAAPALSQVRSETGANEQQRITAPGGSLAVVDGAASDPYQPDELSLETQRGSARDNAGRPGQARLDKPSDFELFVSGLAGRNIRRFGSELLVPEFRDFTAPPTTAVPPGYRINSGDELLLGLTGTVQASNLRLEVDQEGRIFIPRVGPVQVGGVPYRELNEVIASQVARQYRDFRVSVSIGALHGITVYVTGFAATPGSYTVSSLSTVVNAILAAGGPSTGGSFRSVQVRRSGGLVTDFDLYDFLLKGDKRGDVVLQNGDVIYIAPSGAQVAAIGNVNREAIYEARVGDSLNDILLYAGGANTVADISRLHVLDPQGDSGWQELPPDVALARKASRGEVLRVLSAVGIALPSQRLQSLVTVSGEVMKPGRFFVKPGTSLDEVVEMAGGLTPQAYAYGAVFVRDSLRRQQQANFEKAINDIRIALIAQPLVSATTRDTDMAFRLAAVNSLVEQMRAHHVDGRLVLESTHGASRVQGSFVVENNDELYIPPQSLAVGVYGMVNSSANFRYKPGLTIRDYLKMAGGYSRIADKSHIFVVRANGMLLGGRGVQGSQTLPGDLIFVPVDSERGAFWAKLRDLISTTLQGALSAATVIAATK